MASSSLEQEQTRYYNHGQLIEFVRPTHSDGRTWRKLPASEAPSRISGSEARSFYEDVCAADSERPEKNSASNHKTSKSKRKRSDSLHHKKGAKRPHLGSPGLHDVSKAEKSCQRRETSNRSLDRNSSRTGAASGSTSASGNLAHGKREGHYMDDETVETRASQRIRDHCLSELFRMAQNGDAEGVQTMLQKGVNVNCQDQFGWTATMSAAFEGHATVVQTLLKSGADATITNTQGHTASSLAQKRGHSQVVELIESFHRVGLLALRPKKTEKESVRFYCDVCKSYFSDSDESIHKRSTVHIFNLGRKPKNDSFIIPPSNVGYRLMMKTGWDGNRGLGPSGEGHRYPVKTVFKQDRKGLGNAVKEKAKVTHFQPHDKSAVTRMQSQGDRRVVGVRTLSRRAQRAKERRDRQWEINMRHQLS